MKKLVLGSLLAVCALLMTSCLEGGSNERTGVAYGVIEYSGAVKLINMGNNAVKFYSKEIANDYTIENGDCCYFSFIWNQDIPENADASKGYVTVTIDGYTKIPSNYYAKPFLTDTVEMDVNEQIVSEAALLWDFAKEKMFFGTVIKGSLTKQEHSFDLSFNESQEPSIVNGENVYDLYIRVKKTKDGESPIKDQGVINAYNISSLFNTIGQKEQSAGRKRLNFRVNYVSDLNKDKTKAVWKATDILTYTFPTEEK